MPPNLLFSDEPVGYVPWQAQSPFVGEWFRRFDSYPDVHGLKSAAERALVDYPEHKRTKLIREIRECHDKQAIAAWSDRKSGRPRTPQPTSLALPSFADPLRGTSQSASIHDHRRAAVAV
jgi:hypothetical protein